jgi:hypothetical protein
MQEKEENYIPSIIARNHSRNSKMSIHQGFEWLIKLLTREASKSLT